MTKVTVESLPNYTHAQLLTAPGMSLVADEPAGQEGDNLGPTPYDLLTWSLGACTAMTLQMYARRRGYALEHVSVDVEHERIHAKDCAECEQPREGRIEVFRRHITVSGNLSDEERADLLRVAARCPVHKTLSNAPEILDTIDVAG